jgi:serine/threonine protein kinase
MARVDHGDEMADAHLLSEVEAALFGRTPEPWRLGRYLIVESIGRGGFGTVYLGYDPELDRRVAIKVLRGGSGSSGGSRGEQLRSEAQAMAQINHPNVASVYDVARVSKSEEGPLAKEGQLFLVMEYLSGGTLGEMLERKAEASRLVEVFLDAARGLAAAHERGLVHLDFKPANVMFDANRSPESGPTPGPTSTASAWPCTRRSPARWLLTPRTSMS